MVRHGHNHQSFQELSEYDWIKILMRKGMEKFDVDWFCCVVRSNPMALVWLRDSFVQYHHDDVPTSTTAAVAAATAAAAAAVDPPTDPEAAGELAHEGANVDGSTTTSVDCPSKLSKRKREDGE